MSDQRGRSARPPTASANKTGNEGWEARVSRLPPSLPADTHLLSTPGSDLQGLGCPLVAVRLQFNPYPNLEKHAVRNWSSSSVTLCPGARNTTPLCKGETKAQAACTRQREEAEVLPSTSVAHSGGREPLWNGRYVRQCRALGPQNKRFFSSKDKTQSHSTSLT